MDYCKMLGWETGQTPQVCLDDMREVLASGNVWLAAILLEGMAASFPSDEKVAALYAKVKAMREKDASNRVAALKRYRSVGRTDSILMDWVLSDGILECLKPLWVLMDEDAEHVMVLAARLVHLFPWCVSNDELLAEATGRARGIDAAAVLYLEALAKGSRSNAIAINAGLVYMQQQKFQEARQALKLVAGRSPTLEQAHRAATMLQVVEALLKLEN